MTQSGVSRHIKVLEAQVGHALFVRHNRRIELTKVGRDLAPSLTATFDQLSEAFTRLDQQQRSIIRLTAAPSLHPGWLVPRLAAFQVHYPDLEVRLEQSRNVADLDYDGFDAGLRSGDGHWPGLEAHLIMPFQLAPLCSPRLLQGKTPLRSPEALLDLPLLEPHDPVWAAWFEVQGLQKPKLDQRPALRLSSRDLYAQAALAGRGAAMLIPTLYADELASGQLVQPFPGTVTLEGRGYWLALPAARRRSRPLRLLRDWLLKESPPRRHEKPAGREPLRRQSRVIDPNRCKA